MPRPGVRVRVAVEADLPVLVALGDELREAAGEGTRRFLPTRAAGAAADLERRYADALADPARRVVLAVTDEDTPLGMAVLCRGSAGALSDLPAVCVSHVVVADRHRRRGAGKALVAAAAAWADELGVEQVVVSVHPGAREANRFYARLGFAPLSVRRVAPVAVLRRRLATPEQRTAADGHVVRRRPAARRPRPVAVPVPHVGPVLPLGEQSEA